MATVFDQGFYSKTDGVMQLYSAASSQQFGAIADADPDGFTARLQLRGLVFKGTISRHPSYLDTLICTKVQQINETLTPALATFSYDGTNAAIVDPDDVAIEAATNKTLVDGGTQSTAFVTGVVYDSTNEILYVNFAQPVQGPGLFFVRTGWSGRFDDQALVFNQNGLRSLTDPNQVIFENVTLGDADVGDSVVSYDGTNPSGNRDDQGRPLPPFWDEPIPSNEPPTTAVSAIVDLSDPFICEITMSANCSVDYDAIQDGRNWFLRWNGAIHTISAVAVVDAVVTLTISETGETSWFSTGPDVLAYYGGEDDFLDAEGRAIEPFELVPTLPS